MSLFVKKFSRIILASALAWSLTGLLSQSAFAQERPRRKKKTRSYTVDDNPNPKGKGKLIGGIVTASVGGGAGILILIVNLFSYCGDSTSEDYSSCETERQNTNYLGGGILALGVGIGTPLIIMGAKEFRTWKQWNRDNVKGYASAEPVDQLVASLNDQQKTQFYLDRDAARFARKTSDTHFSTKWPLIEYRF